MNTKYHRFDQQQRKYIFAAVAAIIISTQIQAMQLAQEPASSNASSSSKKAAEAASIAAWMNLQSSINRLSDFLTTSLTTTDESRTRDERARAQHSMEEEEGLSDDEKLTLMHVFMRNQAVCSMYLQAKKPELRLAFLKSIVKQVSNISEMAL